MPKKARTLPNQQLRDERIHYRWSQQELADQLGTTLTNVSRWERGITAPGPYFRTKLCSLFGKSAHELGLVLEGLEAAMVTEAMLYDPSIPPIPAVSQQLIGRDVLLNQLKRQICTNKHVALSALNGLPGVGKTALAVALAHDSEVLKCFHDGVLWAGLGPRPNIPGLLSRWGGLLGMAPLDMKQLIDVESWALALRTAIGKRRMLLVIDDAWQIEEALAFKVGGPSCTYLLTTRLPDIALQFASEGVITVRELNEGDGLLLFRQLAPKVVEEEPNEVRKLVQAVGGLPLAITIIGKYLHRQAYHGQSRRLRIALERLIEARERLHLSQSQAPLERSPGFSTGTPLSIQTAIEISDQYLDEQTRSALRALSVFPSKPNSFSEEAAHAVIGTSVKVLDQLSDAGLLESGGSGRYTLHQTIADYAKLHRSDSATEERLVEYFAHYVETHETDYTALEQESANVFAALHAAFDRNMLVVLARTVNAFSTFLEIRGMYTMAEFHLKRAEYAARSLDETITLTGVLLHLGRITQRQGNYTQAEAYYREGLTLARQNEHPHQVCAMLANLGRVADKLGSYAQAESYLQEGLALARQLGCHEQLCDLLNGLGVVAHSQGAYVQAHIHLQEALALARQLGNCQQISRILSNIGLVAIEQGAYMQGTGYWQEGLALARQLGHCELISTLLLNLGLGAYTNGNYAQAEVYLQEGLALARQIGHRERISGLLINLGGVSAERGDYAQAEVYLQEGLALARQIGHRERISGLLINLGEVAIKRGDYAQAEAYLQEGLALARQIGHRERISGLLMYLSEVALKCRNYAQAEAYLQEGLDIAHQIGTPRLVSSLLSMWGELCLQRQQTEAAAAAFDEMLTNIPKGSRDLTAQAQYGLARAAANQGNIRQARKFGETSLANFEAIRHHRVSEVNEFLSNLDGSSLEAESNA